MQYDSIRKVGARVFTGGKCVIVGKSSEMQTPLILQTTYWKSEPYVHPLLM